MSNLWINIRFGNVFFQVSRDRPYIQFTHNTYHGDRGFPDGWFQVHQWFDYHS